MFDTVTNTTYVYRKKTINDDDDLKVQNNLSLP